jgi:hypothetical protein
LLFRPVVVVPVVGAVGGRGGRYFYSRAELLRVFERVEGRAEVQRPPTRAEHEREAAEATARLRARGWKC